jgi:uncharacterized membrane protein YdbT with pleckstrin-like domain
VSERPVVVVRAHASRLLGPALLLLAVAPATGFGLGWAGSRPGWVRVAVVVVAVVTVTRGVVWPFLRWWTTTYALTTHRLSLRWGVLSRHGRDVPLHRVVDVLLERSLPQRALGAGTLLVGTAGEEEPIVLQNLPQARRLHATLAALAATSAPAEGRE